MAGDILDGASVRFPRFCCCTRSCHCGGEFVVVAASWGSGVEIDNFVVDDDRTDAGAWDEDVGFPGKTGRTRGAHAVGVWSARAGAVDDAVWAWEGGGGGWSG